MPSDKIGRNVFEAMGVTEKATDRTLQLIVDGADELGLLTTITGDRFVNLKAVPKRKPADDELLYEEGSADDEEEGGDAAEEDPTVPREISTPEDELKINRKVFISHGKNTKIVAQIKEILSFGEYEPVVTVEKDGLSRAPLRSARPDADRPLLSGRRLPGR